ncbi:MAG: methyl-accepting chemotaxis protein [Desulfobacteraceae bacterium]|nr:methyl-accepting chemotaxis protein [Desulfobacteraceae bacterium]
MKLKIGTKVNLLIVVSLLFVGGAAILFSASALRKEGELAISEYRTGVMNEKTQMLKEMVRIVHAMARDHLADGQDRGIPQTEIKKMALDAIGALRYGEDDTGYFFIFDSAGINILMPVKPEVQGTNMIDTRDPNGLYVMKELIKAAKSSRQGGMVAYLWPKPGHDKPVAKLSFSKRFDAWDWNIGTGIYTDDVDAVLDEKAEEIKAQVYSQVVKVCLVISCIIVISLVAGYLVISRGVVGPIRKMIHMLRDIAEGEGDLTQRIESTSGDETRELADWFNLFIENVQSMITDIRDDSEKLTDSSHLLAGISDQMNEASQGTAARAETVATASEQMSANMASVAAAMEEASTNITIVASASEEMTSTISEIASNAENARGITNNAVSQTGSASDRVNELGKAAMEIGKVVETITDISEQVNLLALNATIEAARAGEAGRGFAVVANEIKELANQTSEATGEIKSRVQDIQDSTRDTVSQISTIAKVVAEINDIVSTIATAVEEQSVTTREIAENVSLASQGIEEVNENVSQASIASGEVSQEISEVTVSSGEMTNSSSQVKLNARDLSELAGHLSAMVGKFKV